MIKLAKRTDNLEESQTVRLDAMAKQLIAEGKSIINLTVGELDFETPAVILAKAHEAIDKKNNHYTGTQGLVETRQAISKYLSTVYKIEYSPEQIIITNGAKQAVYSAIQVLVNPNDEVLVPMPGWVSYIEQVKLAGGIPVAVESNEDFQLDISSFEMAYSENTVGIILNFPNNPTGAVYSKEVLQEIADFAIQHNLWVISDEMYGQLLYDNIEFLSFAQVCKDAIIINGVSKSAAMTGWRVGYAAGPREVITAMKKLQTHLTGNVCNIAQIAAHEALLHPELVEDFLPPLIERRSAVVAWAKVESKITLVPPQGAFFGFIDITQLTEDSEEFAERLLYTFGVAVVPGKYFGRDGYIRISFANSLESIEEGLQRISKCIASYT